MLCQENHLNIVENHHQLEVTISLSFPALLEAYIQVEQDTRHWHCMLECGKFYGGKIKQGRNIGSVGAVEILHRGLGKVFLRVWPLVKRQEVTKGAVWILKRNSSVAEEIADAKALWLVWLVPSRSSSETRVV